MRFHSYSGYGVLLALFALLLGVATAAKPEIDCPDGYTLIQHQPIKVIDGTSTSYTTETRTFTIPHEASFVTTTLYTDGPATTYTVPPQGNPSTVTVIVKVPGTADTPPGPPVTVTRTRTLNPSQPAEPNTPPVNVPSGISTSIRTSQTASGGLPPSGRPSESAPVDTPVESSPGPAESSQPSPSQSSPSQSSPSQSSPSQSSPGPAESSPGPAESSPAESSPAESSPAESSPSQPSPSQPSPSQSSPAESTPIESTPIESTPIESTTVETSSESSTVDTSSESTPIETSSESTTVDTSSESTPAESTPVETSSDSTPVETSSDSSTSETPTPGYVTTTDGEYTGTDSITGPTAVTTIPPSGTVPGTVVIVTPPPLSTFSCDAGGYLIQTRALYRLDLLTGDNEPIRRDVGPGGNINAIGYNTKENLLWGIVATTDGPRIIRIAPDGSSTTLETPLPGSDYNVGDVDLDGNFWVSSTGRGWLKIDGDPDSPTYGTVLEQGRSTLQRTVADWTYVPGGGRYLYSLMYGDNQTRLGRWSLDTMTWEVIQNLGNVAGGNAWGAMYAVGNGIFYASENDSGEIYRFNIDGSPPVKVTDGPATTQNDGARCALAPALNENQNQNQ